MSEYYEITKNSDSTEGRGVTVPTGICFWDKADALLFVKSDRYRKYGVMGGLGSEYDIKTKTTKLPVIYSSIEEYDKINDVENIRKQALEKLTAQERKVLGLSGN